MIAGLAALVPAGLVAGCAGVSGDGALETSTITPGPGTDTGRRQEAATEADAVKVGLLLPLGAGIQMSLVAKGLQQAAELALFERNVSNLQLVIRDDKGTPDGAAAAAAEAIAAGAELILGPLFGTSVAKVAPIARQAGVSVIAFSNDPAVGGNGVHLLSFFAAAETERVVAHAAAQGRRHFAALIPQDALGSDTEPAFRRAVERAGGRIALAEHYPADMSGMMEPAERVMEAIRGSADSEGPIDALFLPSTSDNVPRLVAMLRHHKVDTQRVKLIVTSGWDNPSALRDKRVQGAWLAAPDPGGYRELSARFGKAYNAMPPRLASLAYDAVTIAAAFATQPKGQRYTTANLTRAGGFAGVDGMVRLTAGGPVERSLAILEVQEQGLVTVSPAAGTFEAGRMPAATAQSLGLVPG